MKWSEVKYSTVDGKKGGKVHQGKVKFLLHHHPKMFQQEYLTELPCGYLVCHAFYPPPPPLPELMVMLGSWPDVLVRKMSNRRSDKHYHRGLALPNVVEKVYT